MTIPQRYTAIGPNRDRKGLVATGGRELAFGWMRIDRNYPVRDIKWRGHPDARKRAFPEEIDQDAHSAMLM